MSIVQKQYNAEQKAANKAAVKKPTATAAKPKDQPYLLPVGARDIFFNPGAPDLGNEIQKTPVGHPGISIQITPEGDLAPLIFINTRAPDLGTGKQITPVGDQGRIINAASAPRKGGGANDAPSWVGREAGPPQPGETAQQYATRILNEKYGEGNWSKGGGSEFSKIVKWVTRGGRLS